MAQKTKEDIILVLNQVKAEYDKMNSSQNNEEGISTIISFLKRMEDINKELEALGNLPTSEINYRISRLEREIKKPTYYLSIADFLRAMEFLTR